MLVSLPASLVQLPLLSGIKHFRISYLKRNCRHFPNLLKLRVTISQSNNTFILDQEITTSPPVLSTNLHCYIHLAIIKKKRDLLPQVSILPKAHNTRLQAEIPSGSPGADGLDHFSIFGTACTPLCLLAQEAQQAGCLLQEGKDNMLLTLSLPRWAHGSEGILLMQTPLFYRA